MLGGGGWKGAIGNDTITNSRELFENMRENGSKDIEIDFWAQQKNWSLSSVFQERYQNQVRFIREAFIPFLASGQRLCDLASANGEWSLWLAKYVGYIDGFEYSPKMVNTAKEEALKQGVANAEFRQADACNIIFDKQYDNFMMMGLLTCIFSDTDVENIVEKVYNAIKIGGRLIVKDTLNTIKEDAVYSYNFQNGYQAVYRSKEKYFEFFKGMGLKLEQETILDKEIIYDKAKEVYKLGYCSLGAVWIKEK